MGNDGLREKRKSGGGWGGKEGHKRSKFKWHTIYFKRMKNDLQKQRGGKGKRKGERINRV